ncbi:hypothetical protein [Nocardia jinanensis]|uniref:WXG100 family type VII secretion target n=1 Tax=Nocardia jinanensis TaxID=382504 RepID=A0A917RM20_9NOCA|nr:hypothetical protein [Nocardia jinanensis]GGL14270.1 hypothetical protein GCM10011588_30980 [Nocardia jinanensis]
MSGELRLDLDSLRERGARLADIADRVQQTHAGLRYCLQQAEGSFGDDYMGRTFAEQFTPRAEQVVSTVQAMAEGMRSNAAGIISAANDFGAQDTDSAARVAGAAQDTGPAPAGRAESPPAGTVGPQSPVDGPRPNPPDQAAVTPEQNSPVYPAGGPQSRSTDQLPAGGHNRPGSAPAPDGSPGRAAADNGPRSESPWSRSRPETGPASNQATGAPGGRSGPAVPPPSSAVSPPPVADPSRNTPQTLGRPSGSPVAGPAGRAGAPWTETPPRAPGQPGMPGSPGNAGRPANTGQAPQQGPARPNSPAGDNGRDRDRRGGRERSPADPAIERLARELAERHGVEVTGFDAPDLQLAPVQEFVTAVDRVLTDYPMIVLETVAVAELEDELGTVRWAGALPDSEGDARSITLDRRAAQQPQPPARSSRTPAHPQDATADTEETGETIQPDIYTATLRAFGRAFDAAGGGVAHRRAQRVLISEYLNTQPRPRPALSEMVRGYREWRAELSGNATERGGFDVDEALAVAFAEVVQHGEEAGIQARLLHAVLVAAATRPG